MLAFFNAKIIVNRPLEVDHLCCTYLFIRVSHDRRYSILALSIVDFKKKTRQKVKVFMRSHSFLPLTFHEKAPTKFSFEGTSHCIPS